MIIFTKTLSLRQGQFLIRLVGDVITFMLWGRARYRRVHTTMMGRSDRVRTYLLAAMVNIGMNLQLKAQTPLNWPGPSIKSSDGIVLECLLES